jgi:hypothetical protein
MRQDLIGVILFALSTVAPVHQGNADPLPTDIGACSETTITDIGSRERQRHQLRQWRRPDLL